MTNCDSNYFSVITSYLGFSMMIMFGHIGEFFKRLFGTASDLIPKKGYAPLLKGYDNFYVEYVYRRLSNSFGRPVSSRAGRYIDVLERYSNDHFRNFTYTGKNIKCLNLGSYNYLGFAENPEHVTKEVFQSLDCYGTSACSPSNELGYSQVQRDLEKEIARFVGKEDGILVGMGYATNSTIIPTLAGKGTLIISDSLNHNSIVSGVRSSEAKLKVFKHSNYKGLEKVIRSSIIEGQPRTNRPWKKIIILVEGIYSMEGEIVDLKEVVRIKNKYRCYLYVDEAHSIGALGKTGRGVCEYCNVDPKEVDVLMGTFTKSFGSVGGYVASSRNVIEHIRKQSSGFLYGNSMNPVCAQQTLSSLKVIEGKDGTDIGAKRINQLRENSNFFKKGLQKLNFEVVGDDDSPVVCLMIYHPSLILHFSTLALERGLAIVTVGAPATALTEGRVRFCLSASHTKEDLEKALEKISEIGDLTLTKFKQTTSKRISSFIL